MNFLIHLFLLIFYCYFFEYIHNKNHYFKIFLTLITLIIVSLVERMKKNDLKILFLILF